MLGNIESRMGEAWRVARLVVGVAVVLLVIGETGDDNVASGARMVVMWQDGDDEQPEDCYEHRDVYCHVSPHSPYVCKCVKNKVLGVEPHDFLGRDAFLVDCLAHNYGWHTRLGESLDVRRAADASARDDEEAFHLVHHLLI